MFTHMDIAHIIFYNSYCSTRVHIDYTFDWYYYICNYNYSYDTTDFEMLDSINGILYVVFSFDFYSTNASKTFTR